MLIPGITLRRELNEFEQQNIEKAIKWTLRGRIRKEDLLTEVFITRVHEKMYGDVWAWAGHFRKTNKNIGIDWPVILTELRKLLDDCRYWIEHETYEADEIAIRFKHRLVSIHCFSNGNGRHSRLMADLIANKMFGRPVFPWSGSREAYISAVKAADLNDIKPLLAFARI